MSEDMRDEVKARIAGLQERMAGQTESKKKVEKEPELELEAQIKAGKKSDFKFSDLWNEEPPKGMPDFKVECGKYKSNAFDEVVRGYIPEDEPEYVAQPMECAVFTHSMNDGEKVLIFGPKGSGKSTLPRVYAARTKQPFFRIPCRRDMEASDLFGTVTVRDKKLAFNDGPITLAARYGGVVCLDEASVLQAGAALALQYVLENKGKVMLPDHPSEDPMDKMVTPHPSFRIVMTDNTALAGDHTGMYVGTNVQNEAFRDRIDKMIRLGYMAVKQEIAMINNHVPGVPARQLSDMISFANEIRAAYEKGDIEGATISPRTLIRWSRDGLKYGDFELAFRYCFLNGCSPDDETVVAGKYQKKFGRKL